MLQADLFEQWKKAGQGKFADVPELKTVQRPKIDKVSQDLLARLTHVQRLLDDQQARTTIESRAAAVFEKISPRIRDCAVKPLLRNP